MFRRAIALESAGVAAADGQSMDFYGALLTMHGAWRWVVAGLGVAALVFMANAALRHRAWSGASRGVSAAFVSALDVQLALGLVLYLFVSPLTRLGFGGAPASDERLFFQVTHLAVMVLAVALAHAGKVFAARADADRVKHGRSFYAFALVLCLITAATPWERPWLRSVSW